VLVCACVCVCVCVCVFVSEARLCECVCAAARHACRVVLSNAQSECTAEEAYTHTGGRAIFASGSPFDPVTVGDKTMVPGQANNSYIFPGLALAVTSVRCSRVPNALFATAARALADQVSEAQLASGCLFPPLSDIRNVSARIAAAVAEQAYDLGVATLPKPKNMLEFCVAEQYVPKRVGTLEARL
jgi:malate dehydrogenase (oxaloacetate-decarboxylating)(NADP+)